METTIREFAMQTPDPDRSSKNLERLIEAFPSLIELSKEQIKKIALLFAHSQFLADYCINNPLILVEELNNIMQSLAKNDVFSCAISQLREKREIMKLLRNLRNKFYLRLTLRYIIGLTDIETSMEELTILAEAIIQLALDYASSLLIEKYGEISDSSFAIIALGKLGAGDLNYSSDVDLLSVYKAPDSHSSGILLPSGVRINKIDSHEYFCKLTETIVSLLSSRTEDGIAYRVDLRLRPNGQKGDISLPLESYLSYYEGWGKTWERMALIRARPVAGDFSLGSLFVKMLEPFVWKRTIDYADIEEIRDLKRRIDSIADVNDIKRGYGGIREIEFFVQTFQLLNGGNIQRLRKPRLIESIKILNQEGFISEMEAETLRETYLFLRRLEHFLQMKDDLQTHSLPSEDKELEVISKMMGYSDKKEFLPVLKVERMKVRGMYNSILGDREALPEGLWIFDEGLTDDSLRDYLAFKGFKDLEGSARIVKGLADYISFEKTIRERLLLKKIIPLFVGNILKAINKDNALIRLMSFLEKIGSYESYLDLLSKRKDTIEALADAFCYSSYMTSLILGLENLEGLFEYPDIRLNYRALKEGLKELLDMSENPQKSLRERKASEELKIGLLFISRRVGIRELTRGLTMLADTILRALCEHVGIKKFAIIGLGRLGARELTFGSDLDLIFASPEEDSFKKAEEIIRFLSGYRERGGVYKIDMRLRPDGSKGILVNDIEGYRNYYLRYAQPWELQSLLKSRPVAGDKSLLKEFVEMKKHVIKQRGASVRVSDITNMRKRIIEHLGDKAGYDIKHDRGGIEEIEFAIQYLQLKNSSTFPDLITFRTDMAIKGMLKHGLIKPETGKFFLASLEFLKTIETIVRLNGEMLLIKDSYIADITASYLGLPSVNVLFEKLKAIQSEIIKCVEYIYSSSSG